MDIVVARTANTPGLLYSSLSFSWFLVARRVLLVVSSLVVKFPGGEVTGYPFLRSSSTKICIIGDYPGPVL